MMQTLKFITNSRQLSDSPLPYFIPVPPPLPPFSSSSSSSSSLPYSSVEVTSTDPPSLVDDLVNQFQEMNFNHFNFNPYFYCSDESFEIGSQEWITIHFDRQNELNSEFNVYSRSCLKNQAVCFLIRNISSVNILKVPKGTRLISLLLMENIQSCIIPVTKCYIFSSENKE